MERVYTEICNAPWMFIWVTVVLLLALAQCSVYMRKAWKRALGLGLAPKDVRKGLTTGFLVSIMPTLPVLLIFLSLSQVMGMPLPWMRLSVIGSAGYESYAATMGVQSVGEEMLANGYSAEGWVAAAWLMTIGGSACVLWAILAMKPISRLYSRAERVDSGLISAIGAGCLIGIMGYITVAQGMSAISTKGIVFTVSFTVGGLLCWVQKKRPGQRWISDYLLAISMVAAMIAACVVL